jgi:hypothetical protein
VIALKPAKLEQVDFPLTEAVFTGPLTLNRSDSKQMNKSK